MAKIKKITQVEQLVEVITQGLQDVKAEDIVCIDLTEIDNAICEYFVICTGTSSTHVSALAGSVEKEVRNTLQDRPWHKEGFGNSEWILLDYANVVVHVFQKEAREFYNLEGLWADGKISKIKEA